MSEYWHAVVEGTMVVLVLLAFCIGFLAFGVLCTADRFRKVLVTGSVLLVCIFTVVFAGAWLSVYGRAG